jgi:hypothetical protein
LPWSLLSALTAALATVSADDRQLSHPPAAVPKDPHLVQMCEHCDILDKMGPS